MNDRKLEEMKRTLLAVVMLWLTVGGCLAFWLWPDVSNSIHTWALVMVLGPPLYLIGEVFFGWLLSAKHGAAISRNRFSAKRVLVALPVFLALFVLSWWLARLVNAP